MLPLLQLLSDGKDHHQRDLSSRIGDHFDLNEEERSRMLPSSTQSYLRNRTGWAGFHLRKAGLADSAGKAMLRITDEGRKYLATNPPPLTRAALMQFEPFKSYMQEVTARPRQTDEGPPAKASIEEESTPEERIESAFTRTSRDFSWRSLGAIVKNRSIPFRASCSRSSGGDGLRRLAQRGCRRYAKDR